MKSAILHILVCLICFATQVKAQNFPYRYLPPIPIAPTEEVSCMFFVPTSQASCRTTPSVPSPKTIRTTSGWEQETDW